MASFRQPSPSRSSWRTPARDDLTGSRCGLLGRGESERGGPDSDLRSPVSGRKKPDNAGLRTGAPHEFHGADWWDGNALGQQPLEPVSDEILSKPRSVRRGCSWLLRSDLMVRVCTLVAAVVLVLAGCGGSTKKASSAT